MDKATSMALMMIILVGGYMAIIIVSLAVYGYETTALVFAMMGPVLSIIAMYLGFTIQADKTTVSNLTQLVSYNQQIIASLVETMNKIKLGDEPPVIAKPPELLKVP